MPLLFLGFVFVTFLWLLWAIAWVVVGVSPCWRGPSRLCSERSRCYAQCAEPAALRGGAGRSSPRQRSTLPSGNAAFDEYREETLRKVADEQRGFREFLERLRRSKDKQEFDRFMADRRAAPSTGPQRSLPAV